MIISLITNKKIMTIISILAKGGLKQKSGSLSVPLPQKMGYKNAHVPALVLALLHYGTSLEYPTKVSSLSHLFLLALLCLNLKKVRKK